MAVSTGTTTPSIGICAVLENATQSVLAFLTKCPDPWGFLGCSSADPPAGKVAVNTQIHGRRMPSRTEAVKPQEANLILPV